MKVLDFVMLTLVAALATCAEAAPGERNLRGAVEMHRLEAHKASSVIHSVMKARSAHDQPKQSGKNHKSAEKKASIETKEFTPSGDKLPVPMKDGKIDIPAVIAALKSSPADYQHDHAKKLKYLKSYMEAKKEAAAAAGKPYDQASMESKNVFGELAALKVKLGKKKATKPGMMETNAATTKGDKAQLTAMEGNWNL